jgi:secreted Zn-dependent insulinase-like peptidase
MDKIDGRTNNGGHSTKGFAGRKPKDEEKKLIERLDNIINYDEAILTLKQKIEEGDMRAIQIYFNYRFGKPKHTVQMSAEVLDIKFKDLLKFE